MDSNNTYSVTFKRGSDTIFQAEGFIEEVLGEPYDTASIFYSALKPFVAAKKAGELPKDSVKICDNIEITDKDGNVWTFSENQIEEILDKDNQARKIKLTDDTAIVVSVEGGFSGGDMMDPVKGVVLTMTPEDRKRVEFIVDLLQDRKPKFTYDRNGMVGDFGHYVRIGDTQQDREKMTFLFAGGFRQTPLEVEELREILTRYQE
jgi:hypothetical protein